MRDKPGMFNSQAQHWLAQQMGTESQLLQYNQLPGATSASLFLIEARPGAKVERAVLRLLDNPEWLAHEPDLILHEAAALRQTQQFGLPAPALIAHASEDVGFGWPVLLMSFIEGEIVLRPPDFSIWLSQLARELAHIHRHSAPDFAWQFHSWVDHDRLVVPAWTTVSHLWERAIDLVRGQAPPFTPAFIHRDYHPMNVLWQNGGITGVVDWINGCQGPAGVDVAHCRSNLALMFGAAAAEQFLRAYEDAAANFVYQPYWDLDSILDWGYPEPQVYSPWSHFGLDGLTPTLLKQRLDLYLQQIMGYLDAGR
ncbi:MAG: phosphotransferase [Anaerolineae bacterium]|nr:phosphotransferase [Anaerolineae bacterium]